MGKVEGKSFVAVRSAVSPKGYVHKSATKIQFSYSVRLLVWDETGLRAKA